MTSGRKFLEGLERAVPFVMPAIGGFLAVIYVNLNPMQFLNPMIWIPLGVFLGWVAGQGIRRLLDRWM